MRLTTLVMIGTIAALLGGAVALPTQAKPADLNTQKAEGKQITGMLLRAQQVYQLENSAFATTINDLALPDRLQSLSYRYQMTTLTQAKQPAVMILGRPTKPGLPTYVGIVRIVAVRIFGPGSQDTTSMGVVCESTRAAAINVSARSLPKPQADGMPTCPTGFTSLR